MNLDQLENLLFQGRYLETRALAEELLQGSDSLRLKQIYSLSLSKSGVPDQAENYFKSVYEQNLNDAESAGIMGSIYKELFRNTKEQRYAVFARDIYLRNFNLTGSYYTGINAASLFTITGRSATGREIANRVLIVLGESPSDFWSMATAAEAKLLLKKQLEAIELYYKARNMAGADWGKVTSVYNQLWLMNHYFPVPANIMKAFSPPNIGVFVGHMIDRSPDKVRFPQEIEGKVKAAIEASIKSLNIQIGFCSLACGGDILFAEALEEAGGELNICLPFPKEDFLNSSVRFAGESWVERFERLINRWKASYLTHEPFKGNNDLFGLHGRTLLGSSIIRGTMIHNDPYLITVLSELDMAMQAGGTRDLVKLWPFHQRHHSINPGQFISQKAIEIRNSFQEPSTSPFRVLYMAWMDFPSLKDDEEGLIKLLREFSDEFQDEIIYYKTEQGKLFIGVNSSYAAMNLAKDLTTEYEKRTNRRDFKIGLHAGVGELTFIEGKISFKGLAIDGASILLNNTPPGSFICTNPFASSLVLDKGVYSFLNAGSLDLGGGSDKDEIYQIEMGPI